MAEGTPRQILLLASGLLGESLSLQLSKYEPGIEVILKKDRLTKHPALVIWSLESMEAPNTILLELKRLKEHWKPSPVLLIIPANLRINTTELLNLDCQGLLQDPDLLTLKETIKTLIEGGRVVQLQESPSQKNIKNETPIGLGQWLLVSGLQQINNDLEKIDALLNPTPENILIGLLIKGRKRELLGARRFILWLWGPVQSNHLSTSSKSNNIIDRNDKTSIFNNEDKYFNPANIVLKERSSKAVWGLIKIRIEEALKGGLDNATGNLLAIEGLDPAKRQILFLSLLEQLNNVINKLQSYKKSEGEICQMWNSLQKEMRVQALSTMIGSYVRLPLNGESNPVAEHLIRTADLEQVDDDIPNPNKMLNPLILELPVTIDGQLLPSDNPRALIQIELLINNWLIRTVELISAEVLGACGEWQELRRYLLKEQLLSTRELERIRNQLNSQTRWDNLIERPIHLYESKRMFFHLKGGSIETLFQTDPRDDELRKLGWLQQQVVLLLEARDAIAPQLQTLLKRIGDLMVVLLTKVIGRSIGLIGRGIAQGMGRNIGRGTY